MEGRPHTPEQVARKLREAHRLLAEGTELADARASAYRPEADYHTSSLFKHAIDLGTLSLKSREE